MINEVFVQTSLVVVKTSERDFAVPVALLELDLFYSHRHRLDLVLYGKGLHSAVPVGTGTQPLPSYYYTSVSDGCDFEDG